MTVTANQEKRQFIIESSHSTTIWGFQVIFDQLVELNNRLTKAGVQVPMANKLEIGTVRQYEQYLTALAAYTKLNDEDTWYLDSTPKKLKDLLECYRKNRKPVRIFYGNPETGEDWLSDYGVLGTIGRSTGFMKAPLLLEKSSQWGDLLSVDNILRIVDVDSREEVYRTENYYQPELSIGECGCLEPAEECTHGVWVKTKNDIKHLGDFSSLAKAAHFVAFVTGQCMEPPFSESNFEIEECDFDFE